MTTFNVLGLLGFGFCIGLLAGMMLGMWGSIGALRRNSQAMREATATIAQQRLQIEQMHEMLSTLPHV